MTRKSIQAIAQSLENAKVQSALQADATLVAAANDELFRDLENRWGAGFAQWIIDRLHDTPTAGSA
jgi:hypothetical protein